LTLRSNVEKSAAGHGDRGKQFTCELIGQPVIDAVVGEIFFDHGAT